MKILFIEARKKIGKIKIDIKLPKKIHIFYTIQYKSLAEKVKKYLEKEGHEILGFNQLLGCSKIKIKASPLLVSTGEFHALNLLDNKEIKEIFIYEEGKIKILGKKEILKLKSKTKAMIAGFLASETIGLLLSKKPGQNKLIEIESILKKLKNKFPEKKFYVFVSDIIDLKELENFPVDFWINLACPGIEFDSNKIINYEKILNS